LKIETLNFESKDAKIYGELHIPNKTPAPILIICHGFDKRGFRGHEIFNKLAKTACENGFVSLVFDFRSCGSSTGEFDYGWGEQEDLSEAVNYLASRPDTNPNLICIVGHSLGGAVALYVAQKDKRIKSVALWATPHDHAYNVKKFITMTRGRLSYYLFLLVSYMDSVVNMPKFFNLHVYGITLRPRDVRRKLMKLKESEAVKTLMNTSILIVIGNTDPFVSVEEAKIIYAAANEPKKLVVIESANHVFQGKEEGIIKETLTWLRAQ